MFGEKRSNEENGIGGGGEFKNEQNQYFFKIFISYGMCDFSSVLFVYLINCVSRLFMKDIFVLRKFPEYLNSHVLVNLFSMHN